MSVSTLDQPAENQNRFVANKLTKFKVLQKFVRVSQDTGGCSESLQSIPRDGSSRCQSKIDQPEQFLKLRCIGIRREHRIAIAQHK